MTSFWNPPKKTSARRNRQVLVLAAACLLGLIGLAPQPAVAIPGSLQIFEATAGAGNTLLVPSPASDFTLDIDLDTNTAEGGVIEGIALFRFSVTGDLTFDTSPSSFSCELTGCVVGGATSSTLIELNSPFETFSSGITDVITVDISGTLGQVTIEGQYLDADLTVRDVVPFALAQVPEPGTSLLVGSGLALLAVQGRRRRSA